MIIMPMLVSIYYLYIKRKKNKLKKRAIKLLSGLAVLLALGLGYAIFVNLTGIAIPCIIHKITGLYCPGCGISRMFLYLLNGDIASAASSNIAVFVLLPVFLYLAITESYKYIRHNSSDYSVMQYVMLILSLVVLLVFGVVRNIFAYDILIP